MYSIFALDLKDWLTIWGAVLSTVLAVMKIYEIWRDRARIDASLMISDVDHGNDIRIRNLSGKPIIIEYWEIFAASDAKGKRNYEVIQVDDFSGDLSIAPYTSVNWNFCDANHFNTTDKYLKGRSIYLKICVVGRKPWTQKLYPFDR
jgi:hypothetical protein